MKFQHTTSLAIQPGIQRSGSTALSGNSLTVIPGGSPTYTVSIQQIVFSWTNVTSPGQINIYSSPSDTNPFVLYQNTGGNTIVIPWFDEVYLLGTYGLRAQNNATAGDYTVTAFFTQLTP